MDEKNEAPEYESTDEEFHDIAREIEQVQQETLRLAASLQPSAPQAAEALRQVAGNFCPVLGRMAMACGAALQTLEEDLEESDAEQDQTLLDEEDALKFAYTLQANITTFERMLAAASNAERGPVESLLEMNREMLSRVAELADVEEHDLIAAALKQDEQNTENETIN